MVGKIYLAKIYFTDLSEYKIRPILVIKELDEDCICLQLTSQIKSKDIILTNNNLVDGKLQKDSLVVIPKNFTLHKSILFKYIATIDDNILLKIFKNFCHKIGCAKK
ncbi:MAG: type II toxin-antitoxin system PemK/MazF family toxin [Campylobacterota bacterium]|nr:type II toxin-antitoxin system PemK/MazF family toxin [Campylobacterota bacterium]